VNRHSIPWMVLACATLFVAPEAAATRTYFKDISLEALVPRASIIVRVNRLKTTRSAVPIGKGLRPFEKVDTEYEVLEVLKGSLPESRIRVSDAYLEIRHGAHVRYNRDGVGKSPILERYPDGKAASADEELLIFVQPIEFLGQRQYELVVEDGMARTSAASRVRELIAKRSADSSEH